MLYTTFLCVFIIMLIILIIMFLCLFLLLLLFVFGVNFFCWHHAFLRYSVYVVLCLFDCVRLRFFVYLYVNSTLVHMYLCIFVSCVHTVVIMCVHQWYRHFPLLCCHFHHYSCYLLINYIISLMNIHQGEMAV